MCKFVNIISPIFNQIKLERIISVIYFDHCLSYVIFVEFVCVFAYRVIHVILIVCTHISWHLLSLYICTFTSQRSWLFFVHMFYMLPYFYNFIPWYLFFCIFVDFCIACTPNSLLNQFINKLNHSNDMFPPHYYFPGHVKLGSLWWILKKVHYHMICF